MISLSCAEVLSMYVGESEEKLRNCFVQARLSAPSIIFLDEFDAQQRFKGLEYEDRTLSQLLKSIGDRVKGELTKAVHATNDKDLEKKPHLKDVADGKCL